MHVSRRTSAPAVAGAAILVGALALAAFTAPHAPPPATIATVDVLRVVETIKAAGDWDLQIGALAKRMEDERTARRTALEELARKTQAATGPERTTLREQLTRATLESEQWDAIYRAELDREQGLKWASLYRDIRQETARLAQAEGYDLVLVNDSVTDLRLNPQSQVSQLEQAQEQFMRRRVLYAAKTIDVTDKLILRMNNARAAGTPAGTPAGTAPATTPSTP